MCAEPLIVDELNHLRQKDLARNAAIKLNAVVPTMRPTASLDPDANPLRIRGKAAGAGEGIRTLDPDLGKVVLYP